MSQGHGTMRKMRVMIHIAICDDDVDFAEQLRKLTKDGLSTLDVKPVISVFSDSMMFLCVSTEIFCYFFYLFGAFRVEYGIIN